jgi:Mn-containing catalase
MTREVAHYKMFEAALSTIEPNFPPAVLQADPRFTQQYFNLSKPESVRGPWNQGEMPGLGIDFEYIDQPLDYVREKVMESSSKEMDQDLKFTSEQNKKFSKIKSDEVKQADAKQNGQWNN